MGRPLNLFYALTPWRRNDTSAAKLYGAIVAQARLPVFYQGFGVPDTLEGRFLILSLHLFAVLHRLKREGPDTVGLAQELSDRFSEDMETVLREIGVGDLSIPNKMRGLAASSAALLQAYEEGLAAGDEAVAAAIGKALSLEPGPSEAASGRLAYYLKAAVRCVEMQSFAALHAGDVRFPGMVPKEELGDELHE